MRDVVENISGILATECPAVVASEIEAKSIHKRIYVTPSYGTKHTRRASKDLRLLIATVRVWAFQVASS